jgi:hypothetical protein
MAGKLLLKAQGELMPLKTTQVRSDLAKRENLKKLKRREMPFVIKEREK